MKCYFKYQGFAARFSPRLSSLTAVAAFFLLVGLTQRSNTRQRPIWMSVSFGIPGLLIYLPRANSLISMNAPTNSD